MNAKLAVSIALFASIVYPQSATKTPANKTTGENPAAATGQATKSDQATKEAQRQGRVALNPQAQQSPAQTVEQAIAFERYKELAAEREERKEARSSESSRNADRSMDTPRQVKAKPAKKQ